jgi:3-methyladenine DNA glycosylase AlkC
LNAKQFNNILNESSKEKLQRIRELLKEFDDDENMETYIVVKKIREVV